MEDISVRGGGSKREFWGCDGYIIFDEVNITSFIESIMLRFLKKIEETSEIKYGETLIIGCKSLSHHSMNSL